MRTYGLIITKYPLYNMPLKLKGHPKYSLGGKLLPSRYGFFESSIYLKIKMPRVLNNKKVTFRVLDIDSISLIYI